MGHLWAEGSHVEQIIGNADPFRDSTIQKFVACVKQRLETNN